MTLMKSRAGEVLTKTEWETELDKFWNCFESKHKQGNMFKTLPKRPVDAWDRYVKLMGLEVL